MWKQFRKRFRWRFRKKEHYKKSVTEYEGLIPLSELREGDIGVIERVEGHGKFLIRLIEMGFVVGKIVKVQETAPLGDPTNYGIRGSILSLRKDEAKRIFVKPIKVQKI